MNFKYLVSSIAAAALLMTGCVKEQIGGDLDQIKFEKTIMELPNKPGEVSVKMTATEAWEFNAESVLDDPETGEPWLSVSPASGAAGDFDIVFEALTSYYKDRADTVEFICGGVSQYVILNQPADPSKKPDFEDFVAGDYYIMFLEDDGGNDDASDDKYLVAMPVPQGSSYGYLNAQSAERDEEGNLTSAASNIFSFKETEGGFTIQDAYGKYYYMTGSYNSANVSATLPSSGHVWTVEQTDYYEYTITNVSNGKWMQYSTGHTLMGIYGSAQDGALMPYLVPTVAPSLIKIEQNEYTLQKVAGVLDVPAEIDGNVSVSFEADWLSYVGVKYIDGQSCLEFNYDENDGAEPRTATVLVSVSDGARVSTAELKITQRNIVELPEGLPEDGTSGDPYSVASANAIFDYDAWYRYAEDQAYFKGMVSEITTTDAAEVAQYGNVTFYISADGTEEGEQLYIFRCKYLDNQKFESLDQIQLGSEVIICGNMDVHNGTEEITDCYLYSIDGSAELPSLSVNDKSKSVDADATEVVFEYVARNLTADVTAAVASDDSKIISGEPVVDAGASTVTIALNPNTDQTEKTATVTLSANTEGIEDITLTVTQRAATTVVDPDAPKVVTIEEFKAAEPSFDVWYQLTGEITEISSNQYGNVTIEDETGNSIDVRGITATKMTEGYNDKSFSELGLKVGDIVTIGALRCDFNGTAQAGDNSHPCYYISHVSAELPEGTEIITLSEIYSDVTGEGAFENLVDGETVTWGDLSVSGVSGGTNNRYWANDQTFRMYSGASITFDAGDKVIEKISFTITKGKFNTAEPGELSADGDEWTGSASKVTLTVNTTTQFTSLIVTYKE